MSSRTVTIISFYFCEECSTSTQVQILYMLNLFHITSAFCIICIIITADFQRVCHLCVGKYTVNLSSKSHKASLNEPLVISIILNHAVILFYTVLNDYLNTHCIFFQGILQ